jgi:diadenosine tetraphosphate (Ap4A) HIT family hydrolase
VVAKRHVIEPFELDPEEGHLFWDAIAVAARGLLSATKARRINYEIHGNTLPHLHMHLYPRFAGDPFEGRPIGGTSRGFHRSPRALSELRAAIETERARANRWPTG